MLRIDAQAAVLKSMHLRALYRSAYALAALNRTQLVPQALTAVQYNYRAMVWLNADDHHPENADRDHWRRRERERVCVSLGADDSSYQDL